MLLVAWFLPVAAASECNFAPATPMLELRNCQFQSPPETLPTSQAAFDERLAKGQQQQFRFSIDQAGDYYLWLGVPDVEALALYQWRDQQWHLVFQQDWHSEFASRPHPAARLSVPLRLSAGEHQFYLNYYIHANGKLQPRIYSDSGLFAAETRQHLLNGVLAGMMLMLFCIVLLYQRIAGDISYLAYLGVCVGQLLMLPQIEGYYFQFIWPNAAAFNQWIPVPLSMLLVASHCAFAMTFFQLKQRYYRLWQLHWLIQALMLLNLLLPGEARFIGMSLLAICYGALALTTAIIAWRARLAGASFYLLGTTSLMILSLLMMSLGVLGLNPTPSIDFFNYPKLGFVLESGFFSIALLSKVRRFRREQAENRVRRLAEAEELLQAERQQRAALEQVRDHSLRLAAASHDISQPLASLRFAIDALRSQQNQQPLAEHIDRTLQYAQTLLRDVMVECRDQPVLTEKVRLGDLLFQVASEYRTACKIKGLKLKVIDSSVQLELSYLLLCRIVHNLLSNAIRYTDRGTIVLGVRHRANGYEIQVIDTGIGLLPEQLQKLTAAFTQINNHPEGFGLGLYIVKSLCDQQHFQLNVRSTLQRGSCFSVFIPTTLDSK